MTRCIRTGAAALSAACVLALGARAASAQTAAAPAAPPVSVYKPIRIGGVTVAGSVRVRGEDWSWFESTGADASYTYGHALVRLGATYSNPRFDVMVEGSQPTIFGTPSNAVASGAAGQLGMGASYRVANGKDHAGAFLKQAFVRFKNVGAKGNMARLGRIEFIDGAESVPSDSTVAWLKRERVAHRLLANFAFSAAQRSYDAVHVARATPTYNLTLMAGMPTEGVFQLDGQGTHHRHPRGLRRVHRSVQLGRRAPVWPAVRRPASDRQGRQPSRRRSRDGPLRHQGEHARRERGARASVGEHESRPDVLGCPAERRWGAQDHSGSAFAIEGGVQPSLAAQAVASRRLLAGERRRHARHDRRRLAHGTFFQMLPTPRLYARTPFYNMMNNRDLFSSLILRPAKGTSVRTEVHRLSLTKSSDLWYAGGGAFNETVFGYQGRPSGGSSNLATLADIGADRAFGPLLNVGAYVGKVFGSDVVKTCTRPVRTGRFCTWR